MWNHIYFTTLHSVYRYLIRHYKTVEACIIRTTCLFALMYVFLCRYASFSVPQMLRFGNCLLINSSSYVYLRRGSPRLLMPSLHSDNLFKINCGWWWTCNRLFPTTKQIIDDSLFSVTDYCWVYFGVRVFCIGVIIVILSSNLAWMYALIKKVITVIICGPFSALKYHIDYSLIFGYSCCLSI